MVHVVSTGITAKPVYRKSSSKSSWLVFNGLDTFTTIKFCDQFIGTTDNQFRQYTFDISDALKHCKGFPAVSLEFGSATKIANAIAADPKSQSKSLNDT
jgi:beta-mannosidase